MRILRVSSDRLIIQQLQLQRAENVGIKISDETLNLALANIAERNNVSLAELPALLAREGVDYAAYRRELRQQITIDQLRQQMFHVSAGRRPCNQIGMTADIFG